MDLKGRLQRVLQIVEEAERTGSLSDLEKDIALNELREAYAELKFGITENEERETKNEELSEIAPIAHIESEPEPEPEEESEPEVEVELIFDEESEEAENGERTAAIKSSAEAACRLCRDGAVKSPRSGIKAENGKTNLIKQKTTYRFYH